MSRKRLTSKKISNNVTTMELDFNKLFPDWYGAQRDFVYDFNVDDQYNNFYLAFLGGKGAGKTFAGAAKCIVASYILPNTKGLVTRMYEEDMEDTNKDTLLQICPPELIVDYVKKANMLVLKTKDPHSYSIIKFKGLFRRDKRSSNDPLSSQEFTYFWIDEATEVPGKVILNVIQRLRLGTTKVHFGIFTANPPDNRHSLYNFFINQSNPNRRVYHSSSRDNKSLGIGYINALDEMPDHMKDSLIEGKWAITYEGIPVFPEFKQKFHVKHIETDFTQPLYRSWDFGYRHPAVSLYQITKEGQICVLGTLMGANTHTDEFYRQHMRLLNKYRKEVNQRIYDSADVAGTQISSAPSKTDIEILKENIGVNAIVKYKYWLINNRINEIRKLLLGTVDHQPMFIINDQDNDILIQALLGGYHYADNYSPSSREEPVKDGYYDHVMDELGYFIMNYYRHYKQTQKVVQYWR